MSAETRTKPRDLISSGSPWEARVGYSRAVRVGELIFVSGTVGAGTDAYEQARAAIATIEAALREAGAGLDDVVRTRIFVTNIEEQWELVARAHLDAFCDVRPACSMVEVSRLIGPEFLVEIEADAFVG